MQTDQSNRRDALVVTLAFASGFIDALAYLGMGGIFVSNMTGNTVLLGLAISEGRIVAATRSTTSLLGYLLGVAIGANITRPAVGAEKNSRTAWPLVATTSFKIECIVLGFFALVGYLANQNTFSFLVYVLIALAAMAMGMQSVGVQALGVRGIATTYITGTWTSMVTTLTRRTRRQKVAKETASEMKENTHVQAWVLAFYVTAAIVSGIAERSFLLKAALVPFFTIAIVLIGARKWFRSL